MITDAQKAELKRLIDDGVDAMDAVNAILKGSYVTVITPPSDEHLEWLEQKAAENTMVTVAGVNVPAQGMLDVVNGQDTPLGHLVDDEILMMSRCHRAAHEEAEGFDADEALRRWHDG